MDKLVPVYYTEYGRYISRFRSIPYEMDCLIPVHRRLLLSLYEIASTKLVKCAKVVGHVIGSYHPHGDASAYGSLVGLYWQGFVIGQGNFGSPGLDDAKEASYRYTECRLKDWVKDFCFKYINEVEWENYEYENEPLYLPSPIPIGLIGNGGIYSGIAFHKCDMPRYKLSDLSKRLVWLLSGEILENEIVIAPNFELDGCTITSDNSELKKILTEGAGTLTLCPNGEIDEKNKLHVLGRVPNTSFSSLKEEQDISVNDLSGEKIDVQVNVKRRGVEDLNKFYSTIYQKHLIKNVKIDVNVCDKEGTVKRSSIDDILVNNFMNYIEIVKKYKVKECMKLIEKSFENEIVLIVRGIIEKNHNVKMVSEIVELFKKLKKTDVITSDYRGDKFVNIRRTITEDDIKRICGSKSIKQLIEHKIDSEDINTKIVNLRISIDDNRQECFDNLVELTKSKI